MNSVDVLSEARRLADEQHFKQAQVIFESAVKEDPGSVQGWLGLGSVHHRSGNLTAATNCYVQLLRLKPNCAEALTNLGLVCQELGDKVLAIQLHRQALQLSPRLADAHNNLGSALSKGGNLQEAIVHFKRALEIRPGHAGALYNLGYISELQGDFSAAKRFIDKALRSDPSSETFRFNLATLSLLEGAYSEGWRNYEHRWGTAAFRDWRRDFSQPQWYGEPLSGRTILLHAEQGLGDTMQFVRYVPMVAEMGGRVIVEVQAPLRRLLQGMCSAEMVLSRGDALPPFDVHCPMMSLPLAFGTDVSTIPRPIPYISANGSDKDHWSRIIPPSRVRVGIAWSGNPQHPREHLRALPLAELESLLLLDDVLFVSLQKGRAAEELRKVSQSALVMDPGTAQRDFADTAAIVANLDLVISVDTSVAHLAGAMGKRVWILLHHAPDWRWFTDREDSPWYPNARLFRKGVDEGWHAVIERVKENLRVVRDGSSQ